jgi:hypothetical protein
VTRRKNKGKDAGKDKATGSLGHAAGREDTQNTDAIIMFSMRGFGLQDTAPDGAKSGLPLNTQELVSMGSRRECGGQHGPKRRVARH